MAICRVERMAVILVFAAVIAGAHAGVGRLSLAEHARKFEEHHHLCNAERVSEAGAFVDFDGVKSWVFCKHGDLPSVQHLNHSATILIPEPEPQVLFVKPPDMTYKHKLVLTGIVKGPKTSVYYVPPRVDSLVDVKFKPISEQPAKPAVYFLSSSQSSPHSQYGQHEEGENLLGAFSQHLPTVRGASGPETGQLFGSQEEPSSPDYQNDDMLEPHSSTEGDTITHILRVHQAGGQGKTRLYFIRKKI